MIVFPLIISTLIGLLSFYPLLSASTSFLWIVLFSIAAGLGISALLTFVTFLLFNQYLPLAIIILNLIFLGFLYFKQKKHIPQMLENLNFKQIKNVFSKSTTLLLIVCLFFLSYTIFSAYQHPYGEWDGWALWNMKLKFLVLNGQHWRDIFDKLNWHTQPDYPLLMPMIHVWLGSFCANYPMTNTPFMTSIGFTLLIIGFLYASLKLFLDKWQSFFAASLCFANAYFIYKATSQYADTLFALYLLIILVLLTLLLENKRPQESFALGIMLGLLTFTKNEGIAISALIVGIYAALTMLEKNLQLTDKKKLIFAFAKGLLSTGCVTIAFKLFLAPPNRDILTNLNSQSLNYFNFEGIGIVLNFVIKEIFDKRWVYLWIFFIILTILGGRKLFSSQIRSLTIFFICYAFILLFIYLTTSTMDLSWRLKSTIPRIFFYLMPSIIFFCFLLHKPEKEQIRQTATKKKNHGK